MGINLPLLSVLTLGISLTWPQITTAQSSHPSPENLGTSPSPLSRAIQSSKLASTRASKLNLPQVPDREEARSTLGGSTRGGDLACGPGKQSITDALQPLVPRQKVNVTSESPYLLLYVDNSYGDLDLVLNVSTYQGELVVNDQVTLPPQTGLVAIKIPHEVKKQNVKDYRIKIMVACDGNLRPDSYEVAVDVNSLWNQREEEFFAQSAQIDRDRSLNETQKINQKIELALEYELWLDAVNLMYTNRHGIPSHWSELMDTLEINNLDSNKAPIITQI